ncbi:MAG: adenine phosphoribosyltransferase [Candidatus Schekmanbacteria bacterium]|nr:adenine phosphoribosyltransferase [Candidatus Schekmanbacteria bacterium]
MQELAGKIRAIPDFPKKGILFRDITTLLGDAAAFRKAIDKLAVNYQNTKIDAVVCVESRGFIFGAPIAYKLGAAFVPVRKPGKLPYKTYKVTYDLEYGSDTLEIHQDAFPSGANVLIVDDLLATGGTTKATAELIEKLKGNIVGIAFMIELDFLNGREKLKNYKVNSIIHY